MLDPNSQLNIRHSTFIGNVAGSYKLVQTPDKNFVQIKGDEVLVNAKCCKGNIT